LLEFLDSLQTEIRKVALLGAACSRRLLHLVTDLDDSARNAVEVVESSEGNHLNHEGLPRLLSRLQEASPTTATDPRYMVATGIVLVSFTSAPWQGHFNLGLHSLANARASLARPGALANIQYWSNPQDADWNSASASERQEQAHLLRDIFGNPFRPAVIDPAWLQWNDAAIPRLAQAIYDDRRFDNLPILADALEEAGCTSGVILEHCRGPGPHVLGCWVVDAILGKA
jgi:hypothetical protein